MKIIYLVSILFFSGCASLTSPYHHYDKNAKLPEDMRVTVQGKSESTLTEEDIFYLGSILGDKNLSIENAYLSEIDGYKRQSSSLIRSDLSSFNNELGFLKVYIEPGEHIILISSVRKDTDKARSGKKRAKIFFDAGGSYSLVIAKFDESCSTTATYTGSTTSCSWSWIPVLMNTETKEIYLLMKEKAISLSKIKQELKKKKGAEL